MWLGIYLKKNKKKQIFHQFYSFGWISQIFSKGLIFCKIWSGDVSLCLWAVSDWGCLFNSYWLWEQSVHKMGWWINYADHTMSEFNVQNRTNQPLRKEGCNKRYSTLKLVHSQPSQHSVNSVSPKTENSHWLKGDKSVITLTMADHDCIQVCFAACNSCHHWHVPWFVMTLLFVK